MANEWKYGWQHPPLRLRLVLFGGLLAIAALVLIWQVGSIGLIDETEPLFVEATRQMTLTGDWITPRFNGEPRFDKPPLIYWLMAVCFNLLGVSEWTARLPSVLAAIAITLLTAYTLLRFAAVLPSRSTHPLFLAFLAGMLLLVNPNTFFWGRTAYSDMLLMACVGGSLLSFFWGYAQPDDPHQQRRWYLGFFALMGLAVLTKGPIGLVLPGLAIALFLVYVGNWARVLRELPWLLGMALLLGIAVPWYVLVSLANGQLFIDSFFGYHNVERFSRVVNSHAGPWYFHIAVILVGFLPWSVYLPVAIARLRPWHRRYWQIQPRSHQLGLFALAWFVAVLSFFTLATTKYFSYTLPLMPAAAILVAQWWTAHLAQKHRPYLATVLSLGLNGLLLGVLAVAVFLAPRWLGNDPWMPNLGQRLQASGLPVVGSMIWGVAAMVLLLLLWWHPRWIWCVNLVAMLLFMVVVMPPALAIADAERQLPLRQLAQTAVLQAKPQEALLMLGFKKPSVVYYSQRPVTYLTNPTETLPYLQQRATSGAPSALIVAASKPLVEAGLTTDRYETLATAGVYQLVRVARLNDSPKSPAGDRSPKGANKQGN